MDICFRNNFKVNVNHTLLTIAVSVFSDKPGRAVNLQFGVTAKDILVLVDVYATCSRSYDLSTLSQKIVPYISCKKFIDFYYNRMPLGKLYSVGMRA